MILSPVAIAVIGSVMSGLLAAITVLWRWGLESQAKIFDRVTEQYEKRLQESTDQHDRRMSDKNAELSQVWDRLRQRDDEIRQERAEKEALERMVERGDAQLVDALKTLEGWRVAFEKSQQRGQRRPS
jgi:uncharacterized protein YlxW (UPF0749 family)